METFSLISEGCPSLIADSPDFQLLTGREPLDLSKWVRTSAKVSLS
jgi:hypothetical protein